MLKSLHLHSRFFVVWGLLIGLFAVSFALPALFLAAQVLLAVVLSLTILDILLLYSPRTRVSAKRELPKVLSLGDQNTVRVLLNNESGLPLSLTLIDELPHQFQKRDFELRISLKAGEKKTVKYELRPLSRGIFHFGQINLFISTILMLAERRMRIPADEEAPVYPSILQMKQFELWAYDRVTHQKGQKRLRRIGHSYEFEQIKNYVRGDDYRSINWKASGRRASLMVNQYEDERAQHIYNIIDKSRAMRLPFEGLSLMDYAINTSLALSNIALLKHDRAGLVTFSDKIGATIKADSRAEQLNKIMSALYKEQERPLEANFELLYFVTRKLITSRSLLILYTNFESAYALERALPILRKINKFHLIVVVFFENTEIRDFASKSAQTLEDIYHQTVAQKYLAEKMQMVQKLRQYGIQAFLTRPEELTINAINKYLELKSRGLI